MHERKNKKCNKTGSVQGSLTKDDLDFESHLSLWCDELGRSSSGKAQAKCQGPEAGSSMGCSGTEEEALVSAVWYVGKGRWGWSERHSITGSGPWWSGDFDLSATGSYWRAVSRGMAHVVLVVKGHSCSCEANLQECSWDERGPATGLVCCGW